jgi:molybdenum cofactor synthesis domain-containing protein
MRLGKPSDFKGIRAVVLTVSDSRSKGKVFDESGEALVCLLKKRGALVLKKEIVPDEKARIARSLRRFCDHLNVHLVLTTGGTGLGPRDVTPEATGAVIAKKVPGLIELMRWKSFEKTERAALSRAVAGIRGRALIINLPGSPKGAQESFEAIAPLVPHALAMMRGEGH